MPTATLIVPAFDINAPDDFFGNLVLNAVVAAFLEAEQQWLRVDPDPDPFVQRVVDACLQENVLRVAHLAGQTFVALTAEAGGEA